MDKFKSILYLTILSFLILSGFFIVYTNTWLDESGYLYDSWIMQEYHMQPYNDFWMKTTPLMYLTYGTIQHIFGYTFYSARIISFMFFIGSAILVFLLSKRYANKWSGLISLLLIITTPFLMMNYNTITPHAMVSFFILLSIYLIKNPILSSMFMTLAVLTRVNIFPALIVLFIYFITEKKFRTSFVSSLLVGLFVMSPYLYSFFDNMVSLFSVSTNPTILGYLQGIAKVISSNVAIILLFPFLFFVKYNKEKQFVLILFYVISITHLASLTFFSPIKWLNVVLLIVPLISEGVVNFYNQISRQDIKKILMVVFILLLLINLATFDTKKFSNPLKESDIEKIESVQNISGEKVFVVGDTIYFAYNLKIPTFHPLWGRGTLHSEEGIKHFYTNEQAKIWLNESDLVFIPKFREGLKRYYEPETLQIIEEGLNNFKLEKEFYGVIPTKYDYDGEGVLQIYRRIK